MESVLFVICTGTLGRYANSGNPRIGGDEFSRRLRCPCGHFRRLAAGGWRDATLGGGV